DSTSPATRARIVSASFLPSRIRAGTGELLRVLIVPLGIIIVRGWPPGQGSARASAGSEQPDPSNTGGWALPFVRDRRGRTSDPHPMPKRPRRPKPSVWIRKDGGPDTSALDSGQSPIAVWRDGVVLPLIPVLFGLFPLASGHVELPR